MKVSSSDASAASRILVIDDDRGIRELLCDLLESDERSVNVADTGEAGVGMFRRKGADLVIVDIFMPDKEGFETITELRQESPDVKIIAISGGGSMGGLDVLDAARKFGAVATVFGSGSGPDRVAIASMTSSSKPPTIAAMTATGEPD